MAPDAAFLGMKKTFVIKELPCSFAALRGLVRCLP
jgi:hypothetical protein